MQTKFIRQDFDFSVDDPLDKSVNYGWGMHTMAVFRKRASQQTLGRDFIGTSFDDESPSTFSFILQTAADRILCVSAKP